MNDKNNSNNEGNASSREVPNRNSRGRGPSEEPPVKKRKSDINKINLFTLLKGDIEEILSDMESGMDISTCDTDGMNVFHYASQFNRLTLVEAIINKPNCRNLINSLNDRGESPVLIAAKNSNKHIVTCLLKHGAKFEIADESGMTLLHYASANGWQDIVQDVLRKGINIDTLTFKRETALIFAAKHSTEELVSYLIDKRANCSYCNQEGWGVLHFATKNGWLKTVLTVVNNGVDINAKTVESETALLIAAKFSYKEIVEALIRLRANVHCCDSKGWSLLHYASSYGWFYVAASVVNKEADFNSKTDISETPILLAAKNSHIQMVRYFICLGAKFHCSDKFGRNMLIYASQNGWKDITEYAVEKGMDLDTETSAHVSALGVAIVHKKEDIAAYLITVGANFNFRDQNGWTILHFAAARKWLDVAQLVVKEVDANAKTYKSSSTALEIACVYSHKEVVTLLINAGVDMHWTDRFKKTILHHAAKYGWLDVVQSAVAKGVSIDSLSVDNETPLLVAAQHSHQDVACLLTVLGANAGLFDRYKKTALHYAAEKGWVDVVEAAIKNGTDVNVLNGTGDTPLHLACIKEKNTSFEVFITSWG